LRIIPYHKVSYRIIAPHNLAIKIKQITKKGFSNRLGANKKASKGEEKQQKANEML